jgi:hypothetical protein
MTNKREKRKQENMLSCAAVGVRSEATEPKPRRPNREDESGVGCPPGLKAHEGRWRVLGSSLGDQI